MADDDITLTAFEREDVRKAIHAFTYSGCGCHSEHVDSVTELVRAIGEIYQTAQARGIVHSMQSTRRRE